MPQLSYFFEKPARVHQHLDPDCRRQESEEFAGPAVDTPLIPENFKLPEDKSVRPRDSVYHGNSFCLFIPRPSGFRRSLGERRGWRGLGKMSVNKKKIEQPHVFVAGEEETTTAGRISRPGGSSSPTRAPVRDEDERLGLGDRDRRMCKSIRCQRRARNSPGEAPRINQRRAGRSRSTSSRATDNLKTLKIVLQFAYSEGEAGLSLR